MSSGRDQAPGDPITASLAAGDTSPIAPTTAHSPHTPRPSERPGDSIGPYSLISIIGQGGFGTVWLAERREPFIQRVALKIIKPGMDSGAVIERFEQERQSLALMDHPNIAKVLDGGITPPQSGSRPYFVMEHVAGEPITGFCDRHRLTIRDRLELFATVCDAVQHAHTKGIIHRDLKPSNILVTSGQSGTMADVGRRISDGRQRDTPLPTSDFRHPTSHIAKVIDFGIAKAVSTGDNAVTAMTEAGAFIGTPDYMSPEQAALNADIDTRSDVYSLGLVLYELMAGSLPPDRSSLRAKGLDDLLRTLRESEPSRPSTVIASAAQRAASNSIAGDSITAYAAARQTTPSALSHELRRELEWIPLKALRTDRARRYQSAADLAADVRRYLAAQPLTAGPESRAYRARKFAARHRLALAAAAAVVLTLIAGVAAATAFAVSEGIQRRRTERINAFIFEDVLGAADPRLPADRRFVNAVERAGDRVLAGELAADPEVELGVSLAIGRTLIGFGRFARAASVLEPALTSAEGGRGTRRDLGNALHMLAQVREEQGRHAESAALARRAVEIRRAQGRERPEDLADSLMALGTALQFSGDLAGAERAHRQALDLRAGAPAPDPVAVAQSQNALAGVLFQQGRTNESGDLFQHAHAVFEHALGPRHGYVAATLQSLALIERERGNLDQAAELILRALEISRGDAVENRRDVANALGWLADIRARQGNTDEEIRLRVEMVSVLRAAVEGTDPVLAESLHTLAMKEAGAGRATDALAHMEESESIRRAATPPQAPEHAHALSDLGYIRLISGDNAGAEHALRESAAAYDALGPVNEEQRGRTLVALGMAHLALGRPADAESPLRDALALRERLVGASSWQTANVRSLLGACVLRLGRPADAEPLLTKAAEDMTADPGAPGPRAREAVQRVIDFYESRAREADAAAWRKRLEPA